MSVFTVYTRVQNFSNLEVIIKKSLSENETVHLTEARLTKMLNVSFNVLLNGNVIGVVINYKIIIGIYRIISSTLKSGSDQYSGGYLVVAKVQAV